MVKNLPAMQGLIPGLGRSLGEENVTQSNILAWRIPWTEEPGGLQSMGSLIFPILLILHFPVFEEKAESNFFQKFPCPKFIHFLLKSNHTCEQKVSDTSVQFSRSVVSDSSWPHGLQHAGLPVHHQLPEFTQTHVHWVSDAIQPSNPLSSPYPPTFNVSQHQGLFKWVRPSHQVAKILEFKLQHQSFQWTPRTDFL